MNQFNVYSRRLRVWNKIMSFFLFIILIIGYDTLIAGTFGISYFHEGVNSSVIRDGSVIVSDFCVERVNYGRGTINSDLKIIVPPMMVFGKVLKDQSKTVSYIITNVGQTSAKVDSMVFIGADAAEFRISNPTCPVTINPGTELTVVAIFNPKKIGIKDAKLVIYSNDVLINGEVGVTAEAYTEGGQSLDISLSEDVPLCYALKQNYPNPFNPSTIIEYSVPENCYVSIIVYNSVGQQIESLVNKVQNAGKYRIEWNAKSLAGSLPAGLYFYRMETGKNSYVKKMLLIK